jgi:hypothetical protein
MEVPSRAHHWRARRCRSISAYSIDRGTNAGSGEQPGLPKGRCKLPWNVPINGRCSEVVLSTSRTCFSTDYNWLVRLIYIKATATGMLYCQQMGTRSSGVKKLEMSLVDFCQILWSWVQRFWRESPSPQMPIRYVGESGPPIAGAFPVQPVRASRPTRELAASRRLNQHGTRQRITADSPRRCERLRLSLYDR